MTAPQGTRRTCSRGHIFYKSSDCPVCPTCWSGFYRKRAQSDFPEGLSAPALRALGYAGITSLKQLAERTKNDLLALHGMGPKGVRTLETALKKQGLELKQPRRDRG